jgi:putative peptide zinc metalloprotease protein
MNLSEALDAALPDIPRARLMRRRPPRLDPDLIIHEDTLDGEPIIGLLQRGKSNYFRFTPHQWELAKLFDGVHSYEEIAEAFLAETGIPIEAEDVRAFADQMDENDFWHKSNQEKNLALSEKLIAQRGRRGKSKINLAHISFSAWDPDRYLDWLDRRIGNFVYSKWCVVAVVLLFIFEAIVFVQNWAFIGPDTALFFNFSEKGFLDFVEFWVLLLLLGFVHETAHGLTCKHYGGQVHHMGLMFLYLVPCFFVDVTESWVSATKVQRLATIIAGIWIEMTLCGLAMIVWLNTATGGWLHNFAYEIILLTGIAVVVINLNPLIKLDGYYFLTEIIEIPELKERSTLFLSGWFQKHILGLPVETLIVPRRRAPLFFVYACASGLYSYLLLFFVVRLSYRAASHWLAELALIPSAGLAFVLFRSRLRSLRRVVMQVWEQRKSRKMHLRPMSALAIVAVLAILFVPLLRDRESAYYVIEPAQSRTIHAAVPGRIEAVLVREGQKVRSGTPLIRMSSYLAASMQSSAVAKSHDVEFRTVNAQMKGQSIGSEVAEQHSASRSIALANEANSSLDISATTDGIVLTSNPSLLADQDVDIGQPLLELADAGPRIARVYIPTSALERIPNRAEVAFMLPGHFSAFHTILTEPDGQPVSLPDGIVAAQKYQGIKLPVFYCSRIDLPAESDHPLFGLSGDAKIFGARRSFAERGFRFVSGLIKAHIW